MKETFEFRIAQEFSNLLSDDVEVQHLPQTSNSIRIINITKEDPLFKKIPVISKKIKEEQGKSFFFGWRIKRKYSRSELDTAEFLHLIVRNEFSPTGEECGTIYDDTHSCKICGANRLQKSFLSLCSKSIPKSDIAKSLGGEIVVSERFYKAYMLSGLIGAIFRPVYLNKQVSNFFQLTAEKLVSFSPKTEAGITPFDFSPKDGNEVYKCSEGHTIGLNMISEPYLVNSDQFETADFLATEQKIGVRRGLLQPESVLICSKAFKQMIDKEKLTGFEFNIANIVK